jgi:protein subunit release factor B
MIPINSAITLNENEIQEEFVRSSGPGGQNVKIFVTVKNNQTQVRIEVVDTSIMAQAA